MLLHLPNSSSLENNLREECKTPLESPLSHSARVLCWSQMDCHTLSSNRLEKNKPQVVPQVELYPFHIISLSLVPQWELHNCIHSPLPPLPLC